MGNPAKKSCQGGLFQAVQSHAIVLASVTMVVIATVYGLVPHA